MSLAIYSLHERLTAHLVGTLGGAAGWVESAYPAELMPFDARPEQHQAWAIAVPTTVPTPGDRQSGRGGVPRGTLATTTTLVRWAWWLRSDSAAPDYRAALTGERDLVVALLDVDRDPDLGVVLSRLSRTISTGEGGALLVGTVELSVLHRLPLAAR